MKEERLIAIGDIHGEIKKLNSLLKKLNLTESDTIVFLGDYIDRGKNSKEVIERLIELSENINCIFLKGNHEQMFLKMVKTKSETEVASWLLNGGAATLDNYGDLIEMLTLHGEFLKSLQPYYLTEKYLFVHAGINPNKALAKQTEDDLLWIRDGFIGKKHNLKQKIIFGHTSFYEPYTEDDKIGIDTGCGKEADGQLTAFVCNEERFITSK